MDLCDTWLGWLAKVIQNLLDQSRSSKIPFFWGWQRGNYRNFWWTPEMFVSEIGFHGGWSTTIHDFLGRLTFEVSHFLAGATLESSFIYVISSHNNHHFGGQLKCWLFQWVFLDGRQVYFLDCPRPRVAGHIAGVSFWFLLIIETFVLGYAILRASSFPGNSQNQ